MADPGHWLLAPWEDPLVRRSLVEVVLLGAALGPLGVWTLLHRRAYAAESLAHGMLPGLVLAALAGAPLLLGGAAGLIAAALTIALAGRAPGIGSDTAVAVAIGTLFGAGVLLALAPATPAGLQDLLFGDVLAAGDGDVALAAGLAVAMAVALGALHRPLLALGFDGGAGGALRPAAARIDAALLLLLALGVLIGARALGNLLVFALIVAPAAAARRMSARPVALLATATALGAASGVAGLYVSYYARTAAGASIALCALVPAALAFAARRRRDYPRT